jgi:energy-coupling factor transporter ATP-binding protein EcfA2
MIQIQAIRVEEFRGIRELDLTLDSKSFVIFGPNGSGKSGIVDAIDFALTGSIGRLTGAGTGAVTVLRHGPHVHQRDNPAAARVMLTIRDTTSGQEAVLSRSVLTAAEFTLEPSTPEMEAAVSWASKHPELTLARREVIKYVNAEPGRRAQEVQALLKLDRIDDTRRLLRTAMTKVSGEAKRAEGEVAAAEDSVRRHFDATALLATEMTKVVNRQRLILGLGELGTIDEDTTMMAGAALGAGRTPFNKASALRDVQALEGALATPEHLTAAAEELVAALDDLDADPSLLAALEHRQLVEAGIALTTLAACPLCDLPWPNVESLRAHLDEKLARSESAAALRQRLRKATDAVTEDLRGVRALVRAAQPHALHLGHTALQEQLLTWSEELASFETTLGSSEAATEQRERLSDDPLMPPATLGTRLAELGTAIDGEPDQTATDGARTFLTIAQERWDRVRNARADHTKAAAAQITARAVYDNYNTVADAALTTLYKAVEDDFSNYYRAINADDESSFRAALAPAAGKLDLEVDFYGLGMFPPSAYHSEGHQDGMGLCLYLALIGRLFQSDLRLAVLDDVVTSVDSNHRRQFCRLLKDAFPDVQFTITTHDEVWARQMQSSGLIDRRSVARFHGWTVDGGPIYGQGDDVWDQIADDLHRDDVPGAAHKLRRSLEASMADVASAIGAQIVYRPDNNYELGAFLTAVKSRHNSLLKKAAASANSWNNETAKQFVAERKERRAQATLAQDGENWAINALVHNNDWAVMSKADFEPVVDASRQFLELFSCTNPECTSWMYTVGMPGQEEALRCPCGSLNLNLRTK